MGIGVTGPIGIQLEYHSQAQAAAVVGRTIKCSIAPLYHRGLWTRTISIGEAVYNRVTGQVFAASKNCSVSRASAVKRGSVECPITPFNQATRWGASITASSEETVQHHVAGAVQVQSENCSHGITAAGMGRTI